MKFLGQRIHKERDQPHARKRLGLLEHHKDYVIRARDWHKKERTIHNLERKAALRNKDEFNFGMIKAQVVNGIHRPTPVINNVREARKTGLSRLQYLNNIRTAELRQAEKLRQAQLLPLANEHTRFVVADSTAEGHDEEEDDVFAAGTDDTCEGTCPMEGVRPAGRKPTAVAAAGGTGSGKKGKMHGGEPESSGDSDMVVEPPAEQEGYHRRRAARADYYIGKLRANMTMMEKGRKRMVDRGDNERAPVVQRVFVRKR